MKVISSQHYLDWNRVEEKMEEIKDADIVEIQCHAIGEIDGEEYAVQVDGHHTLAAARELGIEIEFLFDDDPEGLTGEEYLDTGDGNVDDLSGDEAYYDDGVYTDDGELLDDSADDGVTNLDGEEETAASGEE